VPGADNVVLVTVEIRLAREVRQFEIAAAFESIAVRVGDGAAVLDPSRKVTELDVEHGGLAKAIEKFLL